MKKSTHEAQTQLGNYLQVQSYKASAPTCWNAQDSQVIVSYQWMQTSPETRSVIFWAKVNQSEAAIQAYVSCAKSNEFGYAHNTSGEAYYLCKAEAQISKGYHESLSVEVAPQINGLWDTRGYAQNYSFQL